MRRRSASGVMSTSSTWSAARTTSSGIVSRWTMPVMRSTTSLIDSRCWMLTEITVMPASRSSLTSCQRLALRIRGRWCGRARRPARSGACGRGRRRCPSPRTRCPGTRRRRRGRLRDRRSAPVRARPCVSTKPTTTSVPRSRRRRPSLSSEGLADPWGGAQVDATPAATPPVSRYPASSRDRFSSSTLTPSSPRTRAPDR